MIIPFIFNRLSSIVSVVLKLLLSISPIQHLAQFMSLFLEGFTNVKGTNHNLKYEKENVDRVLSKSLLLERSCENRKTIHVSVVG